MTREEAIKHLKDIRSDMWTEEAEVDAIDMAIEALKGDVPDTNVGDMISRQAAINAVKDLLDSMLEADTIGFYEIEHVLFEVPSAQPELIEQGAYVRGFEQGRTQGMIDNTIKAEWTNADALNLQQTCNQLATDCISRQAAIDVAKEELDNGTFYDIPSKIKYLPSAQPEIIRCKDCKFHGYNECFHQLGLMTAFDNNFCSYAERKEQDDG